MPVPILALLYFGSVPVWAWTITGTGIQCCQYQYWHFGALAQYQYGHIPLLVLALNGASTGINICGFWSSTSIRKYITSTGIKLCLYGYWYVCTFVKYQYWYGKLPVPVLNGARTGIGIYAFWSSTSIGTVHYQYFH